MEIKSRKRPGFADNCAASDLAFQLIIYFIIIAGFNINVGFLMHLPAHNSTRLILRDNLLRLDMDSAGGISHNGQIISHSEVELEIGALSASHPDLAVLISIDPKAPWQEVVSFVELVQRLNVNSFSFNMKGAGSS